MFIFVVGFFWWGFLLVWFLVFFLFGLFCCCFCWRGEDIVNTTMSSLVFTIELFEIASDNDSV